MRVCCVVFKAYFSDCANRYVAPRCWTRASDRPCRDPTASSHLSTALSDTRLGRAVLVSDFLEGWLGLQFVADGVFYAELNEMLTRELAEHGYSGVEVRVTPMRTEIIIRATRTQNVLGKHLPALKSWASVNDTSVKDIGSWARCCVRFAWDLFSC